MIRINFVAICRNLFRERSYLKLLPKTTLVCVRRRHDKGDPDFAVAKLRSPRQAIPCSLSYRHSDRAKRGTESRAGSELNFRPKTMETYLGTHVERDREEQFSGNICSGGRTRKVLLSKGGSERPRYYIRWPRVTLDFTATCLITIAPDESYYLLCIRD